jgi:hypothetical protein
LIQAGLRYKALLAIKPYAVAIKEAAMKTWIGAVALTALVAAGCIGTIDMASAAKVITVSRPAPFTPARYQRAYYPGGAGYGAYDRGPYDTSRYDRSRYDRSAYDRSYYDGGYYGRPYLYVPAPFPLGFDFGLGW